MQTTSTTQQALAQAIEVRRVRVGITKRELAERVGLSPASLSKRLAGAPAIDANEIESLATALGLDPFDLMDLAKAERHAEPDAA
jgi:transcriptional regulator with XRE-family HTH domain